MHSVASQGYALTLLTGLPDVLLVGTKFGCVSLAEAPVMHMLGFFHIFNCGSRNLDAEQPRKL